MNFVSHYYLDRQRSEDPHFFFGVITPDLVGIFDRKIKLKPHTIPELDRAGHLPEDLEFYRGVKRHFEADAVFHTSEFFLSQTAALGDRLREVFDEKTLPRSYFLAHILLELLLDKVLIQEHPEILPEFYQHLKNIPYLHQLRLSEWVCKTKMHRYQAYLMRFEERQYLYDYADWRHILFVMRRILDKVNINTGETLHNPKMLTLLKDYEANLENVWPSLFEELEGKMGPM